MRLIRCAIKLTLGNTLDLVVKGSSAFLEELISLGAEFKNVGSFDGFGDDELQRLVNDSGSCLVLVHNSSRYCQRHTSKKEKKISTAQRSSLPSRQRQHLRGPAITVSFEGAGAIFEAKREIQKLQQSTTATIPLTTIRSAFLSATLTNGVQLYIRQILKPWLHFSHPSLPPKSVPSSRDIMSRDRSGRVIYTLRQTPVADRAHRKHPSLLHCTAKRRCTGGRTPVDTQNREYAHCVTYFLLAF